MPDTVKRSKRGGYRGPSASRKGKPNHKPTDETRQLVERLTFAGYGPKTAAVALGLTEATLRKHYPDEIKSSRMMRLAQVADKLYAEALKGNITAAIFILKTQGASGKWSEKRWDKEGATQPAGPVEVVITSTPPAAAIEPQAAPVVEVADEKDAA